VAANYTLPNGQQATGAFVAWRKVGATWVAVASGPDAEQLLSDLRTLSGGASQWPLMAREFLVLPRATDPATVSP
jgi:hypothetical protein